MSDKPAISLEELKERLDVNIPSVELNDLPGTFLWVPVLKSNLLNMPDELKEIFKFANFNGAIFTGAAGNGKHTTAEALAATICNPKRKNITHYIKISGMDFNCENEEDAVESVSFLANIAEECKRLCVYFDSPEDCKFVQIVQYYLSEILDYFEDEPNRFRVIIVTEKPECLYHGLTRKLKLCPCNCPTDAQRQEYLKIKLCKDVEIPFEGLSYMDVSKRTKGFSWKQLSELTNSIYEKLAYKHYMNFLRVKKDHDLLVEGIKSKICKLSMDDIEPFINSFISENTATVMTGAMPLVMPAGYNSMVQTEANIENTSSNENLDADSQSGFDTNQMKAMLKKEVEYHKNIQPYNDGYFDLD